MAYGNVTYIDNGEIYRIWFANDPEGKCYVGQTRQDGGSFERVTQHINDAKMGKQACPLLDEATVRFGIENLRWQVVDGGFETQEELDEAERFYIAYFDSLTPRGYNVKTGGQGAGSVYAGGVQRTVKRLFDRILKRAMNRASWQATGVSFYDWRDIGKILQTVFAGGKR